MWSDPPNAAPGFGGGRLVLGYDTNADGRIDAFDTAGDGRMDTWASARGPSGRTADMSWRQPGELKRCGGGTR